MGARMSVFLVTAIVTAGTALADVCWDRISVGDMSGQLIGEVLLVDAEDSDDGRARVIGFYKLSNGKTLQLECSGSSVSHVMLGEPA